MLKKILKPLLPVGVRWTLRRQYLNFRGWRYKGDVVYCPCCEQAYSQFLPMEEGARMRPNVVCPGCAVVERHRLLILFLKAKTDIYTKPHKVLYFAPEYSMQQHLKRQKNIEYISADIDSSLASEQFDIMDIPYPDNRFSMIFCSHVLAHVKDDRQALRELYRILQKGGSLIILDVPEDMPTTRENENAFTDEERLIAYGQSDRWRVYGQDFIERLSEPGFEVTADNFAKTIDAAVVERNCIDQEELVFVCRKW